MKYSAKIFYTSFLVILCSISFGAGYFAFDHNALKNTKIDTSDILNIKFNLLK